VFVAATGPLLNCTTNSSPLAPLVPPPTSSACVSSLSPASQNFSAAGGSGVATVMAPTGCAWTASSQSSFVTFIGTVSGSGPGFFQYNVGSNASASARQGAITVGGLQTSVTQGVVSGATFLMFTSEPADYIGAGQSFVGMPPTQSILASMDAANHVRFQAVNASAPSALLWELNLRAAGNDPLAQGTYTDVGYWPATVTRPAMSFWGNGRGCSTIKGEFTVLDVAIAPGPVLTRFHATFEQFCNGRSEGLRGEVSYGF